MSARAFEAGIRYAHCVSKRTCRLDKTVLASSVQISGRRLRIYGSIRNFAAKPKSSAKSASSIAEATAASTKLRASIEEAINNYTIGKPTMTDAEYDALKLELQQLEQKYPQLSSKTSPTRRVGEKAITRGVAHAFPMLSINSVHDVKDLAAFDATVRAHPEATEEIEYCVELKYDGMAMSLVFENGKLLRAVTRGDGQKGDEVTKSFLSLVLGVPTQIAAAALKTAGLNGDAASTGNFEVRGEVIMTKQEFEHYNEEMIKQDQPTFMTARNLGVGLIRTEKDSGRRGLPKMSFIAYSLHQSGAENAESKALPTQFDRLKALKTLGFQTDAHACVVPNADGARKVVEQWQQKREGFEYEIDGLVIKVNSLALQRSLGTAAHAPKWALACKFPAKSAQTTLEGVVWQVGRTGRVTPVAQLKPVLCGGVTVSRASLHNVRFIRDLGLAPGDRVEVQRRGDVIPAVSKRLSPPKDVNWVDKCSAVCPCDLKSKLELEGADYKCTHPQCPEQQRSRLLYFVSRSAMNIKGIGPAIVDKLIETGLAKEPADLIKLRHRKLDDILAIWKTEATAKKMLGVIADAHANAMPERIVVSLGITRLAGRHAKVLLDHFGSLDALVDAQPEDIALVDGIGQASAEVIHKGLQLHKATTLKELANEGVVAAKLVPSTKPKPTAAVDSAQQPAATAKPTAKRKPKAKGADSAAEAPATTTATATGPLAGKVFVITGQLPDLSREAAQALIEKAGGQVASGVTKKTSYLVVGNEPGNTKLTAAKKNNVPKLDPEAFRKLLAEPSS